jgi:hypothetical protein
MHRLCSGGKHSEREWPTYRFEVCVRTDMVHNRDNDKFDRGKTLKMMS